MSFPYWERGLKYQYIHVISKPNGSFPYWERGLKYEVKCVNEVIDVTSFPYWERGLKFY